MSVWALIRGFCAYAVSTQLSCTGSFKVTVCECHKHNSKTCVKRPLSKRPKIGFQDSLSLNAGQKYCRMLQGEHSAILLTFTKLPFVIKILVLYILSGRFTQVLLCFIGCPNFFFIHAIRIVIFQTCML